jgi:hypothetical protein
MLVAISGCAGDLGLRLLADGHAVRTLGVAPLCESERHVDE